MTEYELKKQATIRTTLDNFRPNKCKVRRIDECLYFKRIVSGSEKELSSEKQM